METIKGYDIPRETKKDIIYVRMHKTMIKELRDIRSKTGIPISEIIREAVRQTLIEINSSGSLSFKIN
jgi:metal-responsive CopG/Arc/MetJ family transcriptional regulator